MGELERENSAIIIQKWVRGWLVRKQHIDFFKKIKIRRFVIKEIIGFEQTYISKLTYLLNNLKTPLLQDTSISHDKVENIFSNIDEIRQLHITIHNKLIETKPLIITEIYLEVLPKFTIYYPYVKNYNNAYKIYSNLLEEDEQFAQILDQFGYLPSFLILPVQHSPRYLLLFNELLKNTNIQNLDYKNLHKLIESIRETAKQINDCITSNENDDEDTSHFRNNSSGNIGNNSNGNGNKGVHSKHNSVGGGISIKRPASASDKRKPRNSIAMHKKAIDAVLSGDSGSGGGGGSDYSHLPSYLRPTQASSAWSRSKVEYSPSPKWRFSPATGSSFDQSYVYDNPLPTGMNPTSELFNEKHSTALNLNSNTPKKQPSSSSSSSSSSLPPWKPPSKIISSTVDNCTKITKKTVFTRPISPPPKPNFYSPSSSSAGSSTSSMSSSSSSISSISSISSGISSGGSGSSTPSKAANLPLQQLTNNEISLSQSPFSSSKPPLSPSRHSTVNEKVIIEKLSISNENHTSNSNHHHHHTTTTSTKTATSSSSSTSTTTTTKQVKKSLSSNNLFSQTPVNNNSSSNKPSTPLMPPSSSNNNNNNNNNTNNNNDKSTPLSVVVSQ